MQYLDDKYPQHPLLLSDIHKRAINFQLHLLCVILIMSSHPQATHIISSSIQPLQNISFLNYIGEKVGPDKKLPCVQGVLRKGFTALEKLLKDHTGRYATGDEISCFVLLAFTLIAMAGIHMLLALLTLNGVVLL
ncbi:hypothetical protein AHAS_Ahas19G0165500 [Arachis hypogaea]